MRIPLNIIANADDLGLSPSVNKAILFCFEQGTINSASMLTNTDYFEETADLIHQSPAITNIGVHVNMIEGRPLTNLSDTGFLDENGNWDIARMRKRMFLWDRRAEFALQQEIFAQVDRALEKKIIVSHLDSHYHLHTLPCFYGLFIKAAKHYKIKLRIAQTFNEGNAIKFLYRKTINQFIKMSGTAYSDRFETVEHFLNSKTVGKADKVTEIMLHPDFKPTGELTDHFDAMAMAGWLNYLNQKNDRID